ncbi:MAG: alpha/beta hydrolase [Candidatus Acidiferrum sp.]
MKSGWLVRAFAIVPFLCGAQGGGRIVLAQTPSAPAPVAPENARAQTLTGVWSGSLRAGDTVLHLVLHLGTTEYGVAVATIDSLDQGVYGIEAGSLNESGSSFRFEIPSVNASFVGTIAADRQSIDGTWTQSTVHLPLVFRRQPRIALSKTPSGAVSTAEGTWQGALEANGMRYRLQLHISHDTKGQLTAAMDSIDQGINGFRASQATESDSAIHLELPAVHSTYDGTLNSVRNSITGTWRQNGEPTQLTFKRSDQILELRRPQNPQKPYPYDEQELTFSNARAGTSLAATLTLPRGAGPFSAAILLAGSGPLDRDETDGGHHPFLVLADHLTRKGIAVLRFDKRGIGKSTGSYEDATTADFASDAEAAFAFLKTKKEIDPRKIGIIGHSEGGIIASMIASRSNGVAWIAVLAGPATKGEETLLIQSDLITRAAGMTNDQVAKSLDFDRKSYNLVRNEKDRATLERELADLVQVSGLGPAMPPTFVQRQIHWTSSPWFRYFLDYDPVPALQQTKCPVLVLSGEKDLQVPPQQNLPLIRKALEDGGNKDSQVVEMPGLNHQFQHCYMGLPSESRAIEETFAPDAMTAISDWIMKHSAS